MFLVSALMLVGCYKDKGNYDYTLNTMNEIKSVTFSPSVVMSAGGDIIEVQRTENNPHGLIITNYRTVQNKDIDYRSKNSF